MPKNGSYRNNSKRKDRERSANHGWHIADNNKKVAERMELKVKRAHIKIEELKTELSNQRAMIYEKQKEIRELKRRLDFYE